MCSAAIDQSIASCSNWPTRCSMRRWNNSMQTDSIQDNLAALLAHTAEHFHHEEELMTALDYPELQSHRLEHQRLLE